mgnify:CR=1 FL=1
MNASHGVDPPIPAQRVVNRNGMLTGKHHFQTPTLMQELLEKDGVAVINDKVVEFISRVNDEAQLENCKFNIDDIAGKLNEIGRAHV